VLWLWTLLLWGCFRSVPANRPDIILLTVDTLRVDHVQAYNPDSPSETPTMDAIAARGIRFTNAYSPISVTGPAFCSLHTGLLPDSHKVVINLFRGGTALKGRFTTLAEHLRRMRYTTGAFVSGFTLRDELGLSQGFQTYDAPELQQHSRNRVGRKTTNAALEWLVEQEGPILFWYHTFDPHGPLRRWRKPSTNGDWERDPESLEQIARYQRISQISDRDFYAQRYASAVSSTDHQLKRILDTLEEQGRLDKAIVIITADHGESFDERALWFDHGTTPYAEQLHIPLIIKLPGDQRAGEVISTMVGLEDIVPSLMTAAGLPAMRGVDGSAAILSGESTPVRLGESSHCKKEQGPTCFPIGAYGKLYAARDEAHTLIRRSLPTGVTYELYDRVADPMERTVLAGVAPPAHLKEAVDGLAERRAEMDLPEPPSAGAHDADNEELEALRALGYIDEEEDAP
jgi:arylsulfatase A-like enzyme